MNGTYRTWVSTVLLVASGGALANEPIPPPAWDIDLGAVIVGEPEFPGSDSTELRALPAIDISYGRWFLNRYGLGYQLVRNDRWSLSSSLGWDRERRDESDASHLRGTGDVSQTAVALLRGAYTIGRWQTSLAIARDVASEGHGTSAELTVLALNQVTARIALHTGISARWVNDEHASTFFGIDAPQSLASGLPEHAAESGVAETRAFVRAIYAIDPHWIVSFGGGVGHLQGDAADSPIVEDDVFATFDAAAIYRF